MSPKLLSAHRYKQLMPLTVTALISMLCTSGYDSEDKAVIDIMTRSQMESWPQPCSSMPHIMRLIWRVIVNACGESTIVLAKMDCTDAERNALCASLWKHLLKQLERLQNWEAFNLMLDNVFSLIHLVTAPPAGSSSISKHLTNVVSVKNQKY